jgi:hypothetical protein
MCWKLIFLTRKGRTNRGSICCRLEYHKGLSILIIILLYILIVDFYEIVYSRTWELSFCEEHNHQYLEDISAFHGVETILKNCFNCPVCHQITRSRVEPERSLPC